MLELYLMVTMCLEFFPLLFLGFAILVLLFDDAIDLHTIDAVKQLLTLIVLMPFWPVGLTISVGIMLSGIPSRLKEIWILVRT